MLVFNENFPEVGHMQLPGLLQQSRGREREGKGDLFENEDENVQELSQDQCLALQKAKQLNMTSERKHKEQSPADVLVGVGEFERKDKVDASHRVLEVTIDTAHIEYVSLCMRSQPNTNTNRGLSDCRSTAR